jgi:YHS domain-containing protein
VVRLIIFILLGFFLYRLVRRALGTVSRPRRAPDGVIDEMVQDPQCKTYVPRRDARRKVIDGKEHYFCSKECEDKFIAESKRDLS